MSGSTQTTTNVAEPYGPLKPLLNMAIKGGIKAFQGGPNTASNVVPFSNYTQRGMDNIIGLANRNSNGRGLSRQYQNVIDNGGYNNYQLGAMNDMRSQLNQLGNNGLTNAQDNVMGRFQNQMRGLGANGLTNAQDNVLGRFQNQMRGLGANGLTDVQDKALANYKQTANRDYSIKANPGFLGVLERAQNDATNAANSTAAAAGRYGSAIHQGKVASEVGDLTDRMVSDDYNRFLGRQDAANANMASLSQQGIGNVQGIGQAISGLGQQGLGNVQGFGQAISGLGQQGIQNRQLLSSNLFNAGQAGIGNLGAAYEGLKAPERDRMSVGSMYEDLYRRQIDDRNRIQNLPWEQLSKLLAVGSGTGSYNTTTTQAPGPNPLLQLAGGVSLANGLSGLFL